jgi:hypothetical protein
MAVIVPNKTAELVRSRISKETVNLSKTVPNIDKACPIIKNTKFLFNVFEFMPYLDKVFSMIIKTKA